MKHNKHSDLHQSHFGDDFKWGVATAAFQTEGACNTHGKGISIWDTFTAKEGNVKNGHNAETACDFYNSYKKDIDLLKALNIPNFRFSISWTRILPNGTGPINEKGIDYYNNVIDYLLENNIEPWVTLYHWDLPQSLEDKGGWTNREVIYWFSEFATICAKHFGDRVKNWMVINEPSVFTGAGYFLGIHAPGRKGISNFLKAVHHVTLATAAGGRILREHLPDATIGTTISCTNIEPASAKKKDIAAAKRIDTLLNRTFIEPLLGLGYPMKSLKVLRKLKKYMLPEDEKAMQFDFDFIGIQCYTREVIKSSFFTPYIGAKLVSAEKRGLPTTEMGWEIHPPSLYHMLKKFNAYPQIKKIIVTENGAAFPDKVINGKVNDTKRTQYIQEHIAQVMKARKKGLKIDGYFVWTFTDNFEWAEGYHARFGLVHIDFDTQKRTIKNSGYWYRDFLSNKNKS